MAKHETAGLGATLIVLLVLAGALTILGTVIYLRMVSPVPTQPPQPKPTSTLQVPYRTGGINVSA